MLKYVLIIVTICLSLRGISQEEDSYVQGDGSTSSSTNTNAINSGFSWDRVTLGGGLGLTFGNVTYIQVAPNLGYYLTENILAGVGANYTYYNDKVFNFSSTIYGARIFGEYLFSKLPFLAHTEAEIINVPLNVQERKNIINLYLGGGFKSSIGDKSYFFILVLWNMNETRESFILQPNPLIRGGIAIGL